MTTMEAVLWGCPRCFYRLSPSTLPTLKTECPACGGPWVADPPERPRKPEDEKPKAKPTRKRA